MNKKEREFRKRIGIKKDREGTKSHLKTTKVRRTPGSELTQHVLDSQKF